MNHNFASELYKKAEQTSEVELVFDFSQIKSRFQFLSLMENKYNCHFVFATKSFPQKEVLRLVDSSISGFDVSNESEFQLISPYSKKNKLLTFTNPSLEKNDLSYLNPSSADIIISVESEKGFNLVLNENKYGILFRLNSSIILESNLTVNQSRFGFSRLDELKQLVSRAGDRFMGFHVHNGGENNDEQTYIEIAKKLIKLSKEISVSLKYIDFGGGLGNFNTPQLEELIKTLREIVGNQTKMIFEPGLFLSNATGYVLGHVTDVRSQGPEKPYLIVTNISKECHLKWSNPKLVSKIWDSNLIKNKVRVTLVGPTCYENDKIGDFTVSETQLNSFLDENPSVILSNINGYSVAWNTSFNGIPFAKVSFIQEAGHAKSDTHKEDHQRK